MKKKIILTLTLLLIPILLTGCGDVKKSLQDEEFKDVMEERNFTVVDKTKEEQEDNKKIELSYTATSEDKTYKVKYYSFTSEQAAQAFYAKEKQLFGGIGTTTDLDVANFQKYTQTYKNKYGVVSRISNTVVYVKANKDYKEDIKKLLLDIGY